LNGAVLVALILIPLIYPEALPGRMMISLISVPQPPAEPLPPRMQPLKPLQGTRYTDLGLTVPRQIPNLVPTDSGTETAASDWPISMDEGGPAISGGSPFGHSSQPAVRLEP